MHFIDGNKNIKNSTRSLFIMVNNIMSTADLTIDIPFPQGL